MPHHTNFVESHTEKEPSGSISVHCVRSYEKSAVANGYECISSDSLAAWIADMTLSGTKQSTRRRYFGKLHSLWLDGNVNTGDDPFKPLLPCVDVNCSVKEAQDNLAAVNRVLRKSRGADNWIALQAFLYLLYNVDAPVEAVISLTFQTYTSLMPQVDDIIDSLRHTERRKYAFPLNQGKQRSTQIVRELTSAMHSALRDCGMTFANGFSRDIITSMWIAAAVSAGVPVADIRSMVSRLPADYSMLSPITPRQLSPDRRQAIMRQVARSINDNTARWFVMKLRAGVGPDDVTAEVAAKIPGAKEMVSFYYPSRLVARRDGKKIVRQELPYIPDLLFFHTRRDRVTPMFAAIGHLAWCYRVTNAPDSEYSSIPRREMESFQKHVGKFTPDIQLELVTDSSLLNVGSRVRISGGDLMTGHEGIIEKINSADGTRTFLLRLSQNEFIKWTVEVEDIFLEPAE